MMDVTFYGYLVFIVALCSGAWFLSD